MNNWLYIIIPLVIIICGMVCYTKGKADGFREGFDTGERVYHRALCGRVSGCGIPAASLKQRC